MGQLGSHWKFDIWVFFEKPVEKIQVSLKSDKNNGYYEGWNFNSGNYLFTTDTK